MTTPRTMAEQVPLADVARHPCGSSGTRAQEFLIIQGEAMLATQPGDEANGVTFSAKPVPSDVQVVRGQRR
jgi:hypothetical protein